MEPPDVLASVAAGICTHLHTCVVQGVADKLGPGLVEAVHDLDTLMGLVFLAFAGGERGYEVAHATRVGAEQATQV